MSEKMKILRKQGAVEENKKQGAGERNHYKPTSASGTALHLTKRTETDCMLGVAKQKEGEGEVLDRS